MSIKETLALNTITGITTQWVKMAERLDKSMDILREIMQERRVKVKDLEKKNRETLKKIEETMAFKDNLQKMFTPK